MLGKVRSTSTSVCKLSGHCKASMANAAMQAIHATQCRAKSMTHKADTMLNSTMCAWLLLIVYTLLGISAQAAHALPWNMPWNSMVPVHVQEQLFDLCAEKMGQRRVSPLHVRSFGFNVNAVCTRERVMLNPRVTASGNVRYTTLLGNRMILSDPSEDLLRVIDPSASPVLASVGVSESVSRFWTAAQWWLPHWRSRPTASSPGHWSVSLSLSLW